MVPYYYSSAACSTPVMRLTSTSGGSNSKSRRKKLVTIIRSKKSKKDGKLQVVDKCNFYDLTVNQALKQMQIRQDEQISGHFRNQTSISSQIDWLTLGSTTTKNSSHIPKQSTITNYPTSYHHSNHHNHSLEYFENITTNTNNTNTIDEMKMNKRRSQIVVNGL